MIKKLKTKIAIFLNTYDNKTTLEIIIMYIKRIITILLIIVPLLFVKYESNNDLKILIDHFIGGYSGSFYPIIITINFWQPMLASLLKLTNQAKRDSYVTVLKKMYPKMPNSSLLIKLIILVTILLLAVIAWHKHTLIRNLYSVSLVLFKFYAFVAFVSFALVLFVVYIIPFIVYICKKIKKHR